MFKGIFSNIFGSKFPAVSGTVLVVDDTDTDRHFSQKTLEKRGYKTIAATDGRMGVEMARRYRPDLILLDYMMPELSGVEACQILKNDSQTQHIPVIFLTSMDTPKNVIDCFEQGADIFLTKPIKGYELVKQVELSLSGDKKD